MRHIRREASGCGAIQRFVDAGVAIVAALVLLLMAIGLPPWAAALLGGVLVAGIGYLVFRSGLAALKLQELAPRKTIETLKEDVQWLKAQAK